MRRGAQFDDFFGLVTTATATPNLTYESVCENADAIGQNDTECGDVQHVEVIARRDKVVDAVQQVQQHRDGVE